MALMTKLRLAGALLVALACVWIAVDVRAYVGRRQEAARLQKANDAHATADVEHGKGDTDAQHAQDLNPILWTDTQAIEAARAQRDRDRSALLARQGGAVQPAAPAGPGAPQPQPVGLAVDVAALVADDDALDAAQTKKIADLEAKVTLLESADRAHQAEASALRVEVGQLRAIIAAHPTPRLWSVGAVYGTNQTAGGYLSRDLGLVQLGAQVVRRQLNGGQTTLEALVTAGVRF